MKPSICLFRGICSERKLGGDDGNSAVEIDSMTDSTQGRLRSPEAGESSTSLADRFAFKLFRELTRSQEISNVFFSPFSVMLCLLMVWEGASGETREAMSRVLEITGEELEAEQRPLLILKVQQLLSLALAIRGPGLEVAIANSLWCSDQLKVQAAYMAEVNKNYAAEVFSIPMAEPQSLEQINAYVAQKTLGKIPQILHSVDPLLLLLVVNAIYFKALWHEPFERRLTRMERFTAAGKDTIEVPLMHQHSEYSYYEERSFQAVRLTYQVGRVGMYVFLIVDRPFFFAIRDDLSRTTLFMGAVNNPV
jgi:serine protease inhibitor